AASPQKRAASPRKSPKKSPRKSPKKKSPRKRKARSAAHPPVIDMITAAIAAQKERRGSSVAKIQSYIAAKYRCDINALNPHIRRALKNQVKSGALKQVSGVGATGRFRVGAVKRSAASANKLKATREKARARAKAKKAKAAARRKAAAAKRKAAAAKRRAAKKARKAKAKP
nr:RecName: Full=Histone H1, gonadal [Echinolampas crassa]